MNYNIYYNIRRHVIMLVLWVIFTTNCTIHLIDICSALRIVLCLYDWYAFVCMFRQFAHSADQSFPRYLWQPCIADTDILFCSCGFLFFFLLLCFLVYSQRWQIVCLSYFHTWYGLSAKLECRSEMYCTRLAENTAHKKYAKNLRLRTIAQICSTISSQLRHVSTIGKKPVK